MATAMKPEKDDGAPAPASHLTRRKRLELLHSSLTDERQSYISIWQEIARFLFPARGKFSTSDTNRGERRSGKDIIDSTATFAATTLASGMMTGITSPARRWRRLTTPYPELNELASVKAWLHELNLAMDAQLLKSNFYKVMPTYYADLGGFGTACILMEEDEEDGIRFQAFELGTFNLANDRRMRVGVWSREYRLTARQMRDEFGWDKLSEDCKAAWRNGVIDKPQFDVVHVIGPNEEYDSTKIEARHKRFYSCHFEKNAAGDDLLRESGYDEFPILATRWMTGSNDSFGTDCPGRRALGDIKALQQGEKLSLQAIEKYVKPPLTGGGHLKSEKVSQIPGDITYDEKSSKEGGLRPLHEIRPAVKDLEYKQEQVRQRIERAFYADLFLMLASLDRTGAGRDVTAREIDERHEEKLLMLGPVLESVNQDLLDPLTERQFAIMLRRGEIPDPPPELEDVELRVEYISIMHSAQKAGTLGQLDRVANAVIAVATATQDPASMDKLDVDQWIDEYGDAAGVPPRVIRSDEDVAAMRQRRQRVADAAAQAEIAKNEAMAAKTLSETDTRGENGLTDLLRMSEGGAL